MGNVIFEIIKQSIKPGYLYGLGEDGEIYRVEAPMPKPGETIVMPPMHMPREDEE